MEPTAPRTDVSEMNLLVGKKGPRGNPSGDGKSDGNNSGKAKGGKAKGGKSGRHSRNGGGGASTAEDEAPMCMVCAEEINHISLFTALAPCGHNDICSTCALRLRLVHKDMRCPSCNVEANSMVLVPTRTLEWSSVTLRETPTTENTTDAPPPPPASGGGGKGGHLVGQWPGGQLTLHSASSTWMAPGFKKQHVDRLVGFYCGELKSPPPPTPQKAEKGSNGGGVGGAQGENAVVAAGASGQPPPPPGAQPPGLRDSSPGPPGLTPPPPGLEAPAGDSKGTKKGAGGGGGGGGKVCAQFFGSLIALSSHLKEKHSKQFCRTCMEHRPVFASEQLRFSSLSKYQQALDFHINVGDPKAGFGGHPKCDWCKERYYDEKALSQHYSRTHFCCHICDKLQRPNKWFRDYQSLDVHYGRDHWACHDPKCKERRFVAFEDEFQLTLHVQDVHRGTPLAAGSRITFGSSGGHSSSSWGGGGLHDDDDDHRRPGSPPMSAQPYVQPEAFPTLGSAPPTTTRAGASGAGRGAAAAEPSSNSGGSAAQSNDAAGGGTAPFGSWGGGGGGTASGTRRPKTRDEAFPTLGSGTAPKNSAANASWSSLSGSSSNQGRTVGSNMVRSISSSSRPNLSGVVGGGGGPPPTWASARAPSSTAAASSSATPPSMVRSASSPAASSSLMAPAPAAAAPVVRSVPMRAGDVAEDSFLAAAFMADLAASNRSLPKKKPQASDFPTLGGEGGGGGGGSAAAATPVAAPSVKPKAVKTSLGVPRSTGDGYLSKLGIPAAGKKKVASKPATGLTLVRNSAVTGKK